MWFKKNVKTTCFFPQKPRQYPLLAPSVRYPQVFVYSTGIVRNWYVDMPYSITLYIDSNRKALEVELIPIELKLKGWVKILFFINIKRTIWHYTASAHRGTIWEKVCRKDDQGPPRFPYCDRAWWVWCTKAATNITFTATGHSGYGVPKLPQSSHLLQQGMVGMVYQSCHNHHIYCDRA